ncbi:efflux RND transporter permease subunit [Chromobacterium sphagni]|uniref:efflux RND transporter permease subunit n=1 Tax=Chromobacterium sphagni TaxID=1903179 RepID=UPI000A57E2A0|nr:efflux RND transporter permease subunit [Chromobacterium sphagni]
MSKPLEEALNTVSGIKEIRSYSSEGNSVVVAEFELSVDPVVAVQNVRDKVAGVQGHSAARSARRRCRRWTPTTSRCCRWR